MSQTPSSKPQSPLPILIDESVGSSFIDFLVQYRKTLLYTIIGVILLGSIAYRFLSSKTTAAEQDYIQADVYFKQIQAGGDLHDEALAKFQEILKYHGELHQKYDGAIAQNLLGLGEADKASPYAASLFHRLKDVMPSQYREFAQSSLLISEGKYEDALKQASDLNLTLLSARNAPSLDAASVQATNLLYGFNLLRLAMLQDKVGSRKEEAAAWNSFKLFVEESSKGNSGASSVAQELLNLFQEGNVSLIDYINERQKLLVS